MQGSRQQKATAATVTPVRLADGGVALESNFRQGVKHEVLRSLCQLVNTTKLALEVGCFALCKKTKLCPQQGKGWRWIAASPTSASTLGVWLAMCMLSGLS